MPRQYSSSCIPGWCCVKWKKNLLYLHHEGQRGARQGFGKVVRSWSCSTFPEATAESWQGPRVLLEYPVVNNLRHLLSMVRELLLANCQATNKPHKRTHKHTHTFGFNGNNRRCFKRTTSHCTRTHFLGPALTETSWLLFYWNSQCL